MEHPLFLWEMIATEQGASTEAIAITALNIHFKR
jgi:hypothetical protein